MLISLYDALFQTNRLAIDRNIKRRFKTRRFLVFDVD